MIILATVSSISICLAGEEAKSNREFLAEKGPQSKASSMFILSFPSGLKVYLLPENSLGKYFTENVAMTAEENMVGITPLMVELEPGVYRIAVGNTDKPIASKYSNPIQVVEFPNTILIC
jgi:hypothetical protein